MVATSDPWGRGAVFKCTNGRFVIINMCRLCGVVNERLLPFYGSWGLRNEIGVKIQQHLPIKVADSDSLPKAVCYKCASAVVAWHNLTVNSMEVDQKFRDLLRYFMFRMNGEAYKDNCVSKANFGLTDENTGFQGAPVQNEDQGRREMSELLSSDVARSQDLPLSDVLSTCEISSCNPVYESQGVGTCNVGGSKTVITYVNLGLEDSCSISSKVMHLPLSFDSNITSEWSALEMQQGLTVLGRSEIPHLSEVGQTSVSEVQEILGNGGVNDNAFQFKVDHNYFLTDANGSGGLDCCEHVHQIPASPVNPEQVQHSYRQKPNVAKFIPSLTKSLVTKIKRKLFNNVSISYSCEVCNVSFKNAFVLLTHRRFHSGVAPFNCTFCNKSFRLSSSLRNHQMICNNELYEINVNVLSKRDNNGYYCVICGNTFKLKSSIKDHVRRHMGKGRPKFKCRVCGGKFVKKAEIMEHMETHENDGLLSCPHHSCGRKLLNEKDLQDHLISHLDERPFACDTCGLAYKRNSHLQRHKLSHGSDRKTSRSYNRYIPGEAFICDLCGKVSRTARLHNLHVQIHSGERKHECPVCNRRFVQSGAVRRHIRTVHAGARDFSCEICDKSFSAKASLNSHIRIHTGEKPYQCTVCGKTFRTMQLHRVHEKTHSDERPYACSYCPKTFRRRPHLVVHIRTHTGEKPYTCPTCNKGFTQKNDMLKHTNIHLKIM